MSKLALLGGSKAIDRKLAPYTTLGIEEEQAVLEVVRKGNLSQFLGVWHEDFYGGPRIKKLESEWSAYFNTKHSVTVNSNTSGLYAALGAIGLEPGDEVIVPPWTMCATATAPLIWNAIPVFADIEPETFNIDPKSIEERITPRTKAIMVVNIFGHPAALDEIMAIAKRHNLVVIEDNAQAPDAFYKGKHTGTIADIGIFSLNYHKHIHTGEGGVCVTDNDHYAERMQLIRNHAEAVVGPKGVSDISNMIGFNFRMTEIEAAIGSEQLKKLHGFTTQRAKAAAILDDGLRNLGGLDIPVVKEGCTHVYYNYGLQYHAEQTGVPRAKIVEAMHAEGIEISGRYINLHLIPMFQQKIAYGKNGFPWSADFYKGNVSYEKGICPVAEHLNTETFLGFPIFSYAFPPADVEMVVEAFQKIWDNIDDLRQI